MTLVRDSHENGAESVFQQLVTTVQLVQISTSSLFYLHKVCLLTFDTPSCTRVTKVSLRQAHTHDDTYAVVHVYSTYSEVNNGTLNPDCAHANM